MATFADSYLEKTVGQLTMFDRIIFKGFLSGLYPAHKQFSWFLYRQGILLKDYKPYAEKTTEELKTHLQTIAQADNCPIEYLPSGRGPKGESKETLAVQRLQERKQKEGLVAIFSALELKHSFTVRGNRETHHLDAVVEWRKHLHYYLYYNDAELGMMFVRIQSWWPFEIQIYINGHEWLARQLDLAGIGYERYDNCFVQIDDLEAAQKLCDKFAHRRWERVWDNFSKRINPHLPAIEAAVKKGYYWTVEQCEIATDVMFKDKQTLNEMLPHLFEETLLTFSAEDVMRFLGRKLSPQFQGKLETKLNKREAGWRVKHWMKQNSLKMYNKGSVLRVETTINKSDEFKIATEQEKSSRWKKLPKGVAYFWHYYQTGKEANQRYLDALSAVPLQDKATLDSLDSLCQSHEENGCRVAKFQPLSQDTCQLFAAVMRGEYILTGFRNHHIRTALFGPPVADEQEEQRYRARISRLLAKLRGHGLIERIEHAHLYRVTVYGNRVMKATLHFRYIDYPENFSLA